jgi:hypothetical protein
MWYRMVRLGMIITIVSFDSLILVVAAESMIKQIVSD